MANAWIPATATVLLAGGAVGAYFATPFILSGWADDNLLYTKVPEGAGKIIVKGESFYRAILSFNGHHLNERGKPYFNPNQPDWEVLPNMVGTDYETRPALTRSFGLYWVGIPGMRKIYEYDFAWNEYRPGVGGEQKLWHREEKTEVFMANYFSYVMVVEDAKTKDNLPVRAEFVIIVRITNPFKALFASNDWRAQLESYVDRQARNFIGSFTYDELRSETDQGKSCMEENFSKPMRLLTSELPEEHCLPVDKRKGLKGSIGVTVDAANMESIILSGSAAVENERLSIAAYTADRNAETVVKAAEATAQATILDADARAHAIKATGQAEVEIITARLKAMKEDPEMSKTILVTEALGKPGEGKTIVVPAGILDVVSKIFTTKP